MKTPCSHKVKNDTPIGYLCARCGDLVKYKTFRNLPKTQADVFEQIAVNNDGGHHPKTVASLLKKGLIGVTRECLRGSPSVVIERYFVPTPIHIEWCNWCSDQPDADHP